MRSLAAGTETSSIVAPDPGLQRDLRSVTRPYRTEGAFAVDERGTWPFAVEEDRHGVLLVRELRVSVEIRTRVFSNELGEPYRLFHRMWQSIVLKAHGHTPTWNPRLNYPGLSDESQEIFRRINLRWHDLRHEYASRLVEHGVPLAQVRDLLGHASITTTERYDNQTLANLQVAAAKLERGLALFGQSTVDLPGGSLTAGAASAKARRPEHVRRLRSQPSRRARRARRT